MASGGCGCERWLKVAIEWSMGSRSKEILKGCSRQKNGYEFHIRSPLCIVLSHIVMASWVVVLRCRSKYPGVKWNAWNWEILGLRSSRFHIEFRITRNSALLSPTGLSSFDRNTVFQITEIHSSVHRFYFSKHIGGLLTRRRQGRGSHRRWCQRLERVYWHLQICRASSSRCQPSAPGNNLSQFAKIWLVYIWKSGNFRMPSLLIVEIDIIAAVLELVYGAVYER